MAISGDPSSDLRAATALGTPVPRPAAVLGAFGALPFVVLATALVFAGPTAQPALAGALSGYGAVILSFLGGIQWGLAIGDARGATHRRLSQRLGLSVVPSLLGWAALLMPPPLGLWLLAAGLAGALAFDIRAAARREAPAWYPRLRLPLTGAVCAALIVAALLTLAHG